MIFIIVSLFCAVIFTSLAIRAFRSTEPVPFTTGNPIDPKEIRDIPAYNKANGTMWLSFSLPFWFIPLFAWNFPMISIILMLYNCTIGLFILSRTYKAIYKQYHI